MPRVSEPRVEGAVNVTRRPAREQARVRGGTDARLSACLSQTRKLHELFQGRTCRAGRAVGSRKGQGPSGSGSHGSRRTGGRRCRLNRNRLFLSKCQCPALRRCNENQSRHSAHLGVPGRSACPPPRCRKQGNGSTVVHTLSREPPLLWGTCPPALAAETQWPLLRFYNSGDPRTLGAPSCTGGDSASSLPCPPDSTSLPAHGWPPRRGPAAHPRAPTWRAPLGASSVSACGT